MAKGKWKQAASLLAELQSEQATSVIACNCAISACETVSRWQHALELLSEAPTRRLQVDLVGFNSMVSACGKGDEWKMAVGALSFMPLRTVQPDVMTFDSVLMTCVRCSEVQAASGILRMSANSRSPLSYLWSLSVLCVSDPGALEKACIEAAGVSDYQASDAALFLYSTARLGVTSKRHDTFVRHALKGIPFLDLDALLMCGSGAVALPEAATVMEAVAARTGSLLAKVGGTTRLQDYQFDRLGLQLLGVVFSCRLSGCLPARLYAEARQLLLNVGQALDADFGHHPNMKMKECRVASSLQTLVPSTPLVLLDLSDRAALYKPRGWEVYGGHSRLQLVEFARNCFGHRPIFQKTGHHQGFLHRLDVPSSGLVVACKTFEAFYDLQLQLHAGRLRRDYSAFCHGWLPPRPQFAARIFWYGDGPSLSGGRGRSSGTLLLCCRHSLHSLGAISGLLLRLQTGRKHQIRSHLAHVGSPVIGDEIYQAAATHRADVNHYAGNWLHRHKLSFGSASERLYTVECPFPPDLEAAVACLQDVRVWTRSQEENCQGSHKIWNASPG